MSPTPPIRRIPIGVLCLSCLLHTGSCSDAARPDGIPIIQFPQDSVLVAPGDTLRLAPLPVLPPGYVPRLAWWSSDPVVASLRSAGARAAIVTGGREGDAVVTASGDGVRGSVHVAVRAPRR
jgi:hypothetical protein